MGAWFNSIHVKTENSDNVQKILGPLSRKVDCKFLLGPAINGWTSIFPNEIGRESIFAALAELIPHDIFHLMVHDDDVFQYYYYRGGQLIDQYISCFDYYHDEIPEGERQNFAGRPELFQNLLPDSKSLIKLQKLLASDKFTFESERMAQFVELLHLPNAMSRYEYLQEGERDEIEEWQKFVHIESQPVSSEDYNCRGEAKLVKEDLDGALADFNKAIGLNPNLVVARENRDRTIQSKNERNKTFAETWNKFGRIKKDDGDLDGALHGYNKAIELDPNFATAYSNRGLVKKAKGDLDGAIADFNKAIELKPASAIYYSNRGSVRRKKGDLENALTDCNKAIELNPDSAFAYNNRGMIKRVKGDLDGALEDYNKAISLKPDFSEAISNRDKAKEIKNSKKL
jgi:tetratricopeptide (TPR) repeat protein